MGLERAKLRLITYGLGNELNISNIQPIKNAQFVKPNGGLWASPLNSKFGWHEWCVAEEFYLSRLSTHFVFDIYGSVYVIDSLKDMESLPQYEILPTYWSLDFEQMVLAGYDAIHLTTRGEAATRFPIDRRDSLYGWDCECVLVMNPNCILKGE